MSKKNKWRKEIIRRGDKIDPNDIFIFYGWECQHCGVHTPQELRGTSDPEAPTMDHIIPLSEGGEHVYNNVILLCRRCNCYIKSKIKGFQIGKNKIKIVKKKKKS